MISVSLPQQPCHEVLRQERLLELRDRKVEYLWQRVEGLPSRIKALTPKDLPANERMVADKYNLVLWDVDTTLADVIRPMLNTTQTQQHNHKMRITSVDDSALTCRRSRIASMKRQMSSPAARTTAARSAAPSSARKINGARSKWLKIKHAISFIAKVKLPDGPQGEMCRLCQDDKDFGRLFLIGSNPTVIQRCDKVPEKLGVTDEMLSPLLSRGETLDQAAKVTRVCSTSQRPCSSTLVFQ